MQLADNAEFQRAAKRSTPTMLDAIGAAKQIVQDMTSLALDSIVSCKKFEEEGWAVAIDVIEAPARMGDNDLLSTYEVSLDNQIVLKEFKRLRRYHREDRDQV